LTFENVDVTTSNKMMEVDSGCFVCLCVCVWRGIELNLHPNRNGAMCMLVCVVVGYE
jgi:hypothetical protein